MDEFWDSPPDFDDCLITCKLLDLSSLLFEDQMQEKMALTPSSDRACQKIHIDKQCLVDLSACYVMRHENTIESYQQQYELCLLGDDFTNYHKPTVGTRQ